ncbi:MAG: shikimate kinase [Rhodospirillaceae bacterium]
MAIARQTVSQLSSPSAFVPARSIVLVGLMGAGKSAVGKRLALMTGLPFVDADSAIEEAAGCSIAEIFERFGEAEFRAGERRVIARLLDGPPQILAAGGGAYMAVETRAAIQNRGVAVWLKADLATLVSRTAGRTHRPLLNTGDPEAVLRRLMQERDPVYALADLVVETDNLSNAEDTAIRVLSLLAEQTLLPPDPASETESSLAADPAKPPSQGPSEPTP